MSTILFGYLDAFTESVIDGADAAEQSDKAPKQGSTDYVKKSRLGIRQKINAPGDHGRTDDDGGMAENQKRGPIPAPPQPNQRDTE
jgi:hypothetical protein